MATTLVATKVRAATRLGEMWLEKRCTDRAQLMGFPTAGERGMALDGGVSPCTGGGTAEAREEEIF